MKSEEHALKEESLDAFIAMSPENVGYGIGCVIPSQFFARRRHAILVKPLDKSPTLIVADMEEGYAKNNASVKDVRSYHEFENDPIALLADVMIEKGLDKGKIGIELKYIPVSDFENLTKRLPKTKFVGCDELFEEIYAVKSEQHLEILRKVAVAAEKAILEGFETIRAGMTENDLAQVMLNRFYSEGGDGMKLLIIGSGERSGYPNCSPTDRVLRKGDLIRVDFLGLKEYFMSDFVRMAIIDKPVKKQTETYEKLVTAKEKIQEIIRPGIKGSEVYAEYLKIWKELKFNSVRFIGHGLGLSAHERPLLSDFEELKLKKNMLLCVEPLLLYPGVEGYQLEDEILVTKNGYEIITDLMDTSHLYEIR